MHIRAISIIASLIVSTASCATPMAPAATPAEASREDPAAAAVAEVRHGYFGRDWWACARAGEAHLAAHPDSAPLRGWTIACAARAGEDAMPRAEAMLAERPGDPWGLFARASLLIDDPLRGPEEGIPAARAAVQALAHPDATWLLGRALVVHGTREQATAFLAEQPRREASPELLGLELALLSMSDGDVEKQLQALAGRLRALEPTFADGWYLPAAWLLARRRAAEAEPLLVRALERSPHSPAIHTKLWDAIMQSPERSPADKHAAIDTDVAALLRARADVPAAISAAAYIYDDLSPETAERLREDLLARFPDSREAEWARIEQIRRLDQALWQAKSQGGKPDPAVEQAHRVALETFIARPRHPVPALLGEAHMKRYLLVKEDPGASPDALLVAAQGLAAHERQNLHIFADAVMALAERTRFHAEAEAIAREGLRLVEDQFARASPSEDAAAHERGTRSILLCGLGAVLHAQGRISEAREALQQAYTLEHGYPEPFIRLAALAEAEGQPEEAERRLIEGLVLDYAEKIEVALKALYRRRHGHERGFAKYRARIDRGLREQRHAATLATRITDPKPLAPFVLPRLAGGEVRSEALAGRFTVINLWATSCHPCVEELPALQKLVDSFAGAPDVVITSINTDSQTDTLAAWMAERGHRFEVLLGGSWYFEAGFRSLPTTLFVDAQGRVVFIKEGATDRLAEEFTWRIEAMKSSAVGPRKAAPQAMR